MGSPLPCSNPNGSSETCNSSHDWAPPACIWRASPAEASSVSKSRGSLDLGPLPMGFPFPRSTPSGSSESCNCRHF
eukprot:1062269-Pyramimonas_sp.AAC.1